MKLTNNQINIIGQCLRESKDIEKKCHIRLDSRVKEIDQLIEIFDNESIKKRIKND